MGLKKKPAAASSMTEDCQLAAAVGRIAELTGAVAAVAIAAAGVAAVAAVAVVGDGVAVASYAAAAVEAQGYEAGSKPAIKVIKNEFYVLFTFSLNTCGCCNPFAISRIKDWTSACC